MTLEELRKIAHGIRADKKAVNMTKRQFVNALGCEKRTSGNVWYINNFLSENQLTTHPWYENGNIDETMELRYKPTDISKSGFKLYSLSITGNYKNLKDISIDFEHSENYCSFIGLNGSGKSNILELISAIFYSLHHLTLPTTKNMKFEFSYTICYALEGKYYEITDGRLMTGEKLNFSMLPKNIIASYSGEDTRLWENYYKPIYDRYCGKLTAEQQGFAPPFLFYINKEQWEIAMLVLLYSEDIDVKAFIDSVLGKRKCTISFGFANKNSSKWTGTATEAFIDELRKKQTYTVEEFRNTVNNISFIDQASTLFYFLYGSSTGIDNRLISKINIHFDDGATLEGLSEGEKRMILANTIIHILATDNSLCLFDEPDSHIHISRKSELVKLIDSSKRYSILTTHSPVFLEKMKAENIRFVDNGKIETIDKLKQISDLTNGEFSYIEGAFILSSKNIIVVEGTNDIKYIKKAIDIFSVKDSKYNELKKLAFIPTGGASNTESFFNDVIINLLPPIKKLLYIFDYDDAGVDGWEKINKLKGTYSQIDILFYQEDYLTAYEPIKTKSKKSPCFVEDLFHENSYSDIVDELRRKSKFKDFKMITEPTSSKIKTHIEKNYRNLTAIDYNGFEPLLDKLLDIFPKE
ncbi:MAG: AAA family ATPase [Dysgonamonadaceae bacterium]|jgi:ABC-type multidrug transport system ATPase subunit|nr:AAA family ATPase [Dysgonamonadaceae bacterium]